MSDYSVIKKLGNGGRGNVWLVKNDNTGMLCAMKEYDGKEDEAKREVEVLKLLNGRGSPYLIDMIQKGNKTCIIMEYLEGETLRDLIKKHSRMEQKRAIGIIKEICEALAPMHTSSPPYVYADLKPDNIMLTKERGVILFDFGSVIRVGEKERALLSTPGYRPKEREDVDPSLDVYALGVILYEMLTGEIINVTDKTGADISHLPDNIAKVMHRAVHIRKDVRYRNASDMLKDLNDEKLCKPNERRRNVNGYIAEVKRVALCGAIKALLIFFIAYTILGIISGTLTAYAKSNTAYDDEIVVETKTVMLDEADGGGRPVYDTHVLTVK